LVKKVHLIFPPLTQWSDGQKEDWNNRVPENERWWTGSRWSVGEHFERVVFHRVIAYLNERESTLRSVVKECLHGVQINDRIAGKLIAELDVVLALTNGVLIHLECKSWSIDDKDLDARMMNLLRSSSQQARMVVVAPMFPSFADRTWFPDMHARYKKNRTVGNPEWLQSFTLHDA